MDFKIQITSLWRKNEGQDFSQGPTAHGNPLVLASSNFELVKTPQPNVPVSVPPDFKVVNGLNRANLS